MPPVYRSALPALCLSLILPCALSVEAADSAPSAANTEQTAPAPERQPLLERSQEDALALERQLPQHEQQQLQAAGESFLTLWKPANSPDPTGVVIIVPGAGETADWPQAIGPLREKLPDAQWGTLSLSLPDLQSDASQPRVAEVEKPPVAVDSSSKDASTAAPKPIEQATSGENDSDAVDKVAAQSNEDPLKADAERIYARIDAAITYAQQQNARSIVLLGHGTGAWWAARYITDKQPPQIQKLVMVAALTPARGTPDLQLMTPTLKLATADFVYTDKPLARKAAEQRLQGSKRQKGSTYTQISLKTLPGNSAAEQEQLYRRVRGWLSPQPVDN